MNRSLTAWIGVAALLMCGCGEELPTVVWHGVLVDYAASPEAEARLCAGTGPRVDAAARAIAERIGDSDRPRFTYYWLPEGLDATDCDERVSLGCASRYTFPKNWPPSTYSRLPVHDHEVAHIYAGTLGRADPFLEEGFAEYLGGGSTAPARGDPTALYGRPDRLFDPNFYPTAGRFIAGAAELSSFEAIVSLYRRSDAGDGPATFEAKFEAETGLRPDDVAAHNLQQASCGPLAYREDPVACGGAPVVLDGDGSRETIKRQLHCDLDTVWGSDDAMQTSVAVRVVAGGTFDVAVNAGTQALLSSCAPGCAFGAAIPLEHVEPEDDDEDVGTQSITVPAGLYSLRIDRGQAGFAIIEFDP